MTPHTTVEFIAFRVPPNQSGLVVKSVDQLRPTFLRTTDPKGFEWSGDDQDRIGHLARAILEDVLADDALWPKFKVGVLQQMPHEGFRISASAVDRWAEELESGGGKVPQHRIEGVLPGAPKDWLSYMPEELPPPEWLGDLTQWPEDNAEGLF